VIRGYFDESYRDRRVYAIGGYVGRDKEWDLVSKEWRNRRLEDGIQCFHATDCEAGRGEFEHLSKEQRTKLKADLIEIVHKHENLGGFGAAVIIEDFEKVRDRSDRARQVLGPDPYFLCLQMLLSDICAELEKHKANPGIRVAYVFEEQEEFSGKAKTLYDKFKRFNVAHTSRMGSLTYASKGQRIPLEIADNLAYETMKEILNNRYDPERPRRISMGKMIPRLRNISLMTEKELNNLSLLGRTDKD
jgi:hypothetical protein